MIRPEVLIGDPIEFGNIAMIKSPTVRESVTNRYFNLFLKLLTISQEDIWDEILKEEGQDVLKINEYIVPKNAPTPLEQIIKFYSQSPENKDIVKKAFFFFTGEAIRAIPENNIVVFAEDLVENVKIEDVRILDNKIFFDFQNAVRMAVGYEIKERPDENENPRKAKMKAKARERDRIKAKSKKTKGISFSTSLLALCSMGIGLTPINIGDLAYAAVSPLLTMGRQKESYEADILIASSGFAKKGSKTKHWIREEE